MLTTHVSKGNPKWKNAKFPGKASSADQETTYKKCKYLLRIIQEKGYGEKQVFKANEIDFFYKDIGKWTNVMQMEFQLIKNALPKCS